MSVSRRRLLHAGMIADGTGRRAAPGAILLEGDRILAAGSPQSIGHLGDVKMGKMEHRPGCVLMPALVNVHAHLDLSHIGPTPAPGRNQGGGEGTSNVDFLQWVDFVRARRAAEHVAIRESVLLGARLAQAGGTALIGDIAGVRSLAAIEALRESGLSGVSFLEVFGQGRSQDAAIEVMQSLVGACESFVNGVRLGVQPHAPYSCGQRLYEAATDLGLPLATHLAETLEEITFTQSGGGPFADLLRRIGVWDETITGCGAHPIDALAPVLGRSPWIAAHLNYITPRHIDMLGQWPITVAYCPRASAYFNHPADGESPHRYREMNEAGINVAIGTDSILCLDTPDRLSVLDDMRLLHRRDGTDPLLLLRMGTVNGAAALGFDPALVTLDAGPSAGILELPFDAASALDPLKQVMMSDAAPRWALGPLEPARIGALLVNGLTHCEARR